jgi:tRNA dimethylallyltransferase
MLEMGLVEEIKSLLSSGIPAKCTAMQAIGYKEFIAALDGRCTIEDAADQVRQSSRHYAKRQLTWFRRNKSIHWLTRSAGDSADKIIEAARQVVLKTDK